MENSNENATRPHGQKGMVALVVAVIVLVLVALGLGTAYFFQMQHTKNLQRQVDDLKTAAARMDEEMAQDAAKETGVAKPTSKYREIPELGVRYKLTEETKELTYQYDFDDATSLEMARFTTIELARLKDDSGVSPCASNMPSGTVLEYKAGEAPQPNADPRSNDFKKVGERYFSYAAPETACMVGAKEVSNFSKSVNAVKAAYASLEAM